MDGWKILKDAQVGVEGMEPCCRIVCLGNFKQGKTWFLDKFSGLALPANSVRHTAGICSRRVKIDGKSCDILDVKGENTPLSKLGKDRLQEKKLEESFIRDLVCLMSDGFVYLVNQMGYQEQLTLQLLTDELDTYVKKSLKTTPTIIMVHNLRNFDMLEELQEEWEKIKGIYSVDGYSVEEHRVTDPDGRNVMVEYLSKPLVDGQETGVQIQHFHLGKDGSLSGVKNWATIQHLRNKLICTLPAVIRPKHFLDELTKSMNQRIQSYFTTNDKFTVVSTGDRLVLADVHKDSASQTVPADQASASGVADKQKDSSQSVQEDSKPLVKMRDVPLGDFVSSSTLPQNHAWYRISTTQKNEVRVIIDLPSATQELIRASLKSKEEKKKRPLVLERDGGGVTIYVRPGLIGHLLLPGECPLPSPIVDVNATTIISVNQWYLQSPLKPTYSVTDGVASLTWKIDDPEETSDEDDVAS